MTPGVQATTSQTASSEDPQGSYRKVVNGQSFAGSSHLLDGTDNHDALLGLIVINPTLESLTEAKITTANYDAEFGATAGVISAQTSRAPTPVAPLAYFLRDDAFMARNPFTQFQPIPAAPVHPGPQWNQFGGALGRADRENRTCSSLPITRGRDGTPAGRVAAAMPSAAERQGDLASWVWTSSTRERATRSARSSGNRIPTALSRSGQNLLADSTTRIDGTGMRSAQLRRLRDDPVQRGSREHALDYYLSGNTQVFGRYSLADYRMDSPGIFGELAGGRGFDEVAPFAGIEDPQPEHRRRVQSHVRFEPADRFPVRLVSLSRQRRPGRRRCQSGG